MSLTELPEELKEKRELNLDFSIVALHEIPDVIKDAGYDLDEYRDLIFSQYVSKEKTKILEILDKAKKIEVSLGVNKIICDKYDEVAE